MALDFEWSSQLYSVRDIIQLYSFADQLPVIVRVTEGYCSNDTFHEFGAGQILCVYDIAQQERVVFRESGGRFISIPCSYPGQVRIKFREGRVVNGAWFSEFATVFREQPNKIGTVTQCLRGNESDVTDFGELQPVNVYEEPYLLAHTIINGELYDTNTFIPAYVPIAMSVAVALRDRSQRDFHDVVAGFNVAASARHNDCVVGQQEIIALPHSQSESEYEYLIPVMHIDTARSGNWRVDYDSYLKAMPCPSLAHTAGGHDYDDELYETPIPAPLSQRTEAAPPIPARDPTAKRSTQPRHVVAVSPQPPRSPAGPVRDSGTPSYSSHIAHTGSTTPARVADRPSARRPSDPLTQTLAHARPIGAPPPTTAGDQDDDVMSKDMHDLSVEEVSACLHRLKMSAHVDDFIDNEVDGEMLSCLNETVLTDDFHFSGFNAIKLMKFVWEGYTPRITTLKRTGRGADT